MEQKAHSHFKNIIIVSILIFITGSCSLNMNEEEISASRLSIDTEEIPNDTITALTDKLKIDNGIYYFDTIPYSGFIRSFYENGAVKSIAGYLNGRLNGTSISFYENGNVRDVRNYKDNKSYGRHYGYWGNGNQKFDYVYLNDKRDGINKQWYESGQPYAFLNFKNDSEHGLQQAWRENGKLYINYEAKDGFRYGLQKSGLCYTLIDEKIKTE